MQFERVAAAVDNPQPLIEHVGSRKIRQSKQSFREEWPFVDEGIQINRCIYIDFGLPVQINAWRYKHTQM